MQAISNDKEGRRYRRERNMVAKNNKHKGGFHTDRKRPMPMILPPQAGHGGMTIQEINEWWESNV